MKNWKTLEADVNMIMGTHFTSGRGGRTINKILVHHNCGNLSVKDCYDVWQTRAASAHYQVDANGVVGQLVWDADTAWHAGNWDANTTSIGIEHADISNSPWQISEATLDNGAHLVAALCHYYKLGRPAWRVNVFPHNAFSSTECPASIAGTQNAAYMARAQKYYDNWNGEDEDMSQADVNLIKDKVTKNNDALGRMEKRPTHVVFQLGEGDSAALGIANIMAGTYELFTDSNTWAVRKMIIERTGYVLKEWREYTADKKSNVVRAEDLAGFGVQIGGAK